MALKGRGGGGESVGPGVREQSLPWTRAARLGRDVEIPRYCGCRALVRSGVW